MVLELPEQSKEYNCGVFALQFLLRCFARETPDAAELERQLETTEEYGTSHERILFFLKGENILCGYDASLAQLSAHLPAIVNYQYADDGHYSVVLAVNFKTLILYNPWLGELEVLDKEEFYKRWYSKLYGNRWFLTLTE